MKSKILSALFVLASAFSLVSCGSGEFDDKDFDGLYDLVDPNPSSNVYSFKYQDLSSQDLGTNVDKVTIDFRNFLFDKKPTYKHQLAKMAATIVQVCNDDTAKNLHILNDTYENEESSENRLLVQYGFQNVKHILSDFEGKEDEEDCSGIHLGNHVMEYEGSKYQIFIFAIEGYPNLDAWYSNFDVGADSETYASLYGEHPDWINKNHHKGFDVCANRLYPILTKYINDYKYEGAEAIVFGTGQSRGGSISSLIGKRLFDDGYKSTIYALNNPGPLFLKKDGSDVDVSKYTNIFNINNEQDFMARFPFEFWNSARYGRSVVYSLKEHAEEYKEYYKVDYECLDSNVRDTILDVAQSVMPTRNSFYEYRTPDVKYPEFDLYKTKDEADDACEELNELISSEKIAKCFAAKVEASDDETNPYKVQKYTRPFGLFAIVSDVIKTVKESSLLILALISKFTEYLPFLGRYVEDVGPIIDIWFPNPNEVKLPHYEKSCLLGVDYAHEVEQ